MATRTKTARTIVASISNAVGDVKRGTLNLTATDGGFLTIKITNGGTGPSGQCIANVLVAHNASTPTAASAGTDWKTIASFGGGTANNAVTERSMNIPAGVMQLEVEFKDNAGQAVTVESYFSELVYS